MLPGQGDPFNFGGQESARRPTPNPSPEANVTPWGEAAPQEVDPFSADDDHSAAPAQAVGPPLSLLLVAAGSVVVAALLLLFARQTPAVAFFAWLLAGPVCITAAGFFLGSDVRRRATPYYVEKSWARPLQIGVVIAGLALVFVAAWSFADWVGRL